MNWSKIQIWSCRKCCFTIPLSFYYCWNFPPWPLLLDSQSGCYADLRPQSHKAPLALLRPKHSPARRESFSFYGLENTEYAKTALLLLWPSVGNPHEQLGHPQPPSVTHRAITAHFSFAPFSIEAKFKDS